MRFIGDKPGGVLSVVKSGRWSGPESLSQYVIVKMNDPSAAISVYLFAVAVGMLIKIAWDCRKK
jgi:hypothetical protein